MFHSAYDSYMTHAFPKAELRPLSCIGGTFELVKIPMVTLIDTLDTLAIMGNFSEFRRAVKLGMYQNFSTYIVITKLVMSPNFHEHIYTVCKNLRSFDIDVNVSVFETNIRILGDFLSPLM
jgi:mannosidase alpha-like ER degradation enhancer 2